MTFFSRIVSTGSYLPEKIVTNADLEKIVDTSDEWIFQRTGIRERRVAADRQPTSDLAVRAAKAALESGGVRPDQIDGIIVATTTADQTFPSVAVRVQQVLDIPVCPAFDIQAVCTGFIYALSVADNFIRLGQMKRILVIGAEKMSSLLNWEDRTTCVLFGDGAGAVILEATDDWKRRILSTHLYSDGRLRDLLYTDGGPGTTGQSGHIIMQGREVFKNAVNFMADAVLVALEANKMSSGDIDWLVPHQANIRIIEATAKKLDLPMEKVILTVERHGNTSAASIPLALDEGVRQGKITQGDVLLLEAMGGGITWGSALIVF